MSKIEDKSYLKRTRATWISEKTGLNFARAHAIVHDIARPTPREEKKISNAIREDRVASLYKKL